MIAINPGAHDRLRLQSVWISKGGFHAPRPIDHCRRLLAAVASQVWAHTPYMKPSALWTEHDVSAETAYSTDIFTPVVGIPAEGLSIISPSGERLGLSRIEVAPDVTRIEAQPASSR